MRRKLLLILLLGVAPLLHCGDSEPDEIPPRTAAEQTLRLLELADGGELAPASVEELFDLPEDETESALLFDSIQQLASTGTVRVVAETELAELNRWAVDLERDADNVVSTYSVQLDTLSTPAQIVWFSGPGIEWPERRRRGDGLSTSATPDSLDGN